MNVSVLKQLIQCRLSIGPQLSSIRLLKREVFGGPKKRCFCSQSESELLNVTNSNGIKTITMEMLSNRNALSLSMMNSLYNEILTDVDSVRVIILRSSGSVFSAGHNLKELTQDNRSMHRTIFQRCSDLMKLIQDIPSPVIAEVSGLATAAGCQLVASCDLAVASHSSKFATPGVKVGLFCSTPAVALARAVPRKTSMKMLLTGEPMSAEEALRSGLISHLVEDEKLSEETEKLAKKICESSGSVIAVGKRCFYQQVNMDRDSAYEVASVTMAENLTLNDGKEGIDAFVTKRKPTWKNT